MFPVELHILGDEGRCLHNEYHEGRVNHPPSLEPPHTNRDVKVIWR